MVKVKTKGNFSRTKRYLSRELGIDWKSKLKKYADEGTEALKNATPVDTGVTAGSWSSEIVETKDGISIVWSNSNKTHEGTPIVILLQYGHATKTGSYVFGQDFINTALKPVFDKIEKEIGREVRTIDH